MALYGRYHEGDFTKGMLFLGACICTCACFYKAGVFKNKSIQKLSRKISTLKYSKLLCVVGAVVLVFCPMGFTALVGREYLAWVVGGVFGSIYLLIFNEAIDANDPKNKARAARRARSEEGDNSKGRKSQGAKRAMSTVHKKQDSKIKGKKKI